MDNDGYTREEVESRAAKMIRWIVGMGRRKGKGEGRARTGRGQTGRSGVVHEMQEKGSQAV